MKCNRDCLNCIYDDCIEDDNASLSYEELKQARDEERERKIEEEIADPNTPYSRKVYLINREDRKKSYKKYYREHAKEIAEKHRRYNHEHEAECKARAKRYYQENREIIIARQKEYYRRKKNECD